MTSAALVPHQSSATPAGPTGAPEDLRHRALPWATVLPLAVVASFADVAVVIVMRGAVGSIERTRGPFLSWVLESTLLVPFFALAVMLVLMAIRRRVGVVAHRGRTVVGAWLAIAGALTLPGVAVLGANAWLDEHLQVEHLEHMGSMGTTCFSSCLERLSEANLLLQVHAVGWGSLMVLGVNVVAVGWLLGLRGGQLRLVAQQGVDMARRPSPARDGRLLLALALAGSGVIHVAVAPDHFELWWLEGWFFVLLAAAQLAVAGLVLTSPGRRSMLLSVLVCAGPLALWLLSRLVGIPFGPEPWEPEPVGLADLTCALLEQAALVLAVAQLRRSSVLHRYHGTAATWRLAVVAVLALTVLGTANGFSLLGQGHQHDDDEQVFDWTSIRESHPRPPGPA